MCRHDQGHRFNSVRAARRIGTSRPVRNSKLSQSFGRGRACRLSSTSFVGLRRQCNGGHSATAPVVLEFGGYQIGLFPNMKYLSGEHTLKETV